MDVIINRDEFQEAQFDSSRYVSSHLGIPLDTLRNSLISILKTLRTDLIDLINREYESFISLSTNLIGFDDNVTTITQPLLTLRSKVENVRKDLILLFDIVNEKISERKRIRDEKATINMLLNIHETLNRLEKLLSGGDVNEKLLERIAGEYNQLMFTIEKVKSLEFVKSLSSRIDGVNGDMSRLLNEGYTKALLDSNYFSKQESLMSLLQTFVVLDRISDAERIFVDIIAGPSIDQIISQSKTLENAYQSFLAMLTQHSQILTASKILNRNFYNQLFGMFVDSLQEKFKDELNPALVTQFRTLYKITLTFLRDLKRIESSLDTSVWLKKWNVNVYGRILHDTILEDGNVRNVLEKIWNEENFLDMLLVENIKTSIRAMKIWQDGIKEASVEEYLKIQESTNQVNTILEKMVYPRVPDHLVQRTRNVFESIVNQVNAKKSIIEEKILKNVVEKCEQVNMTASIPREYRGTKKEVGGVSAFLGVLFGPLDTFIGELPSDLEGRKKEWGRVVVDRVTQGYMKSVEEMLEGVKSVEESLRRLKRRRDVGDEERIKRQVEIDVTEFSRIVGERGGDKSGIEEWKVKVLGE